MPNTVATKMHYLTSLKSHLTACGRGIEDVSVTGKKESVNCKNCLAAVRPHFEALEKRS